MAAPMRIFRHYTELPAEVRGAVVALGNFDGVHLGHQAVIGTAVRIASQGRRPAGVMTFEPHPRALFNSRQSPFRLTPFRIKARHIETLGVDYLFMQHFDRDFAALTAEQFADVVLHEGLQVSHVVVGYDFVFGAGRGGNLKVLERLAHERGFAVTCVGPARGREGEIYSSTGVREALAQARPDEAARLLGRYWEIEGRVEPGDRRGRVIGFPTANIELGEYQHPALGVYAIRAGIDRGGATLWHDGIANFGNRPTFDKTDALLETHLFDFGGDLYGQHLRVALIEFIRAEAKFSGIDALKAQIDRDCQTARRILAEHHFSEATGPSVPSRD